MKTISHEQIREIIRKSVLVALDESAKEITDDDKFYGWLDSELPQLLKAIDAHTEKLIGRINDNSPTIRIATFDAYGCEMV